MTELGSLDMICTYGKRRIQCTSLNNNENSLENSKLCFRLYLVTANVKKPKKLQRNAECFLFMVTEF